jgi:hypothetical protein
VLLKLGIEIGKTCVAKDRGRRRGRRFQGWKSFLRNHVDRIAVMEAVSTHPTAERIANQLTEACGWDRFPAISSVISIAPMVRSLSQDFDPWYSWSADVAAPFATFCCRT